MEYEYKILNFFNLNNSDYNDSVNSPFFRTEWLSFIESWRGYKPIIIQIKKGEELIGYFCGFECKILFFKLLGSPLPGCLGQTMGFDLRKNIENKVELIDTLLDFLVFKCGYHYITITDEKIGTDILLNSRYNLIHYEDYETWHLDLNKPLESIKKGFTKTYRNYINKFNKIGGIIKEDPSVDFIKQHNDQLIDVYNRDGISSPNIIPKYSKLLDSIKNSDMLYCIRADLPNTKNIGSSIYLYFGEWAFFLSNASYTQMLQFRPNQSLMWNAIQYLQFKGIKNLDLVGDGQYKGYYGAKQTFIPIIAFSRIPFLVKSIHIVKRLYYMVFRLKSKILTSIIKTK